MTEHSDSGRQAAAIAGLIALIILLVLGIKGVFRMLESLPISRQPPAQSDQSAPPADSPAPDYCLFCGQALPESFQWGMYCPYCGKQVE